MIRPQVSDPETEREGPRVAHVIRKDAVLPGYVDGVVVEALCGVLFVPTRDPKRYPVCEMCKEKLKQVSAAGRGEN